MILRGTRLLRKAKTMHEPIEPCSVDGEENLNTCDYVELVCGYGNCVLEFACQNSAIHGAFCEEHRCFDFEPID